MLPVWPVNQPVTATHAQSLTTRILPHNYQSETAAQPFLVFTNFTN